MNLSVYESGEAARANMLVVAIRASHHPLACRLPGRGFTVVDYCSMSTYWRKMKKVNAKSRTAHDDAPRALALATRQCVRSDSAVADHSRHANSAVPRRSTCPPLPKPLVPRTVHLYKIVPNRNVLQIDYQPHARLDCTKAALTRHALVRHNCHASRAFAIHVKRAGSQSS